DSFSRKRFLPKCSNHFILEGGIFKEAYKYGQFKRPHRILLVIAIIFIAFNLRPAITSVGPIIDLLREGLSLSHFSIGFFTSLILIAFCIQSSFLPLICMAYTFVITYNSLMILTGLCIIYSH